MIHTLDHTQYLYHTLNMKERHLSISNATNNESYHGTLARVPVYMHNNNVLGANIKLIAFKCCVCVLQHHHSSSYANLSLCVQIQIQTVCIHRLETNWLLVHLNITNTNSNIHTNTKYLAKHTYHISEINILNISSVMPKGKNE